MAFDDKGGRLHGRLEFFDRNVTQLTKHVAQIIGHHQGKAMLFNVRAGRVLMNKRSKMALLYVYLQKSVALVSAKINTPNTNTDCKGSRLDRCIYHASIILARLNYGENCGENNCFYSLHIRGSTHSA